MGENYCLHYPEDGSSGFLRNIGIIYQTSRFYHTILKRPIDMITHYTGKKNKSIIYMNTKYRSKRNHLLYNYYLWATCFDSLESSSGPTKNRSKVI